jgi:hypothetical protein
MEGEGVITIIKFRLLIGLMEENTKEATKMILKMDMGHLNGRMVVIIRAIGKKENSMAKEL